MATSTTSLIGQEMVLYHPESECVLKAGIVTLELDGGWLIEGEKPGMAEQSDFNNGCEFYTKQDYLDMCEAEGIEPEVFKNAVLRAKTFRDISNAATYLQRAAEAVGNLATNFLALPDSKIENNFDAEISRCDSIIETYIVNKENEAKPKRTRKPKDPNAPPKVKKEPKPKKVRLTKEEKEIQETQENRIGFQIDATDYPLDDLVVFPTPEWLAVLETEVEIGFDLETLGIVKQNDALTPEKGEIRLIQAYLPSVDKVIVWDLGTLEKRLYTDYSQIPGFEILWKKLSGLTTQVFIHNAAFESKWIAEKFKKPILNVVDSMILSQIYYAGLIRGFIKIGISNPNALNQVVWRLFQVKLDKTDQSYDYAMPITNRQLNYGAKDAKYTYLAGKELLKRCYNEGLGKVIDAELISIPAFAMMCYRGIPFNPEIAKRLLGDYKAESDKAIQAWLEKFPGANPGSPKQVLNCLHSLGIDPKNGDGKSCTDNATLTPFALQDPLIEGLLFWRSLKKDCEYLEQYLMCATEQRGFTVVRTEYRQNAPQATGRSASSNPNLQNIPTPTPKRKKLGLKPIRSAFRVPDGYKLIIVDLAASHAELARYIAKDAKLQEAHDTGIKLHFYTVAGILKLQGTNSTPLELSKAKKDKNHPLYKQVSELYDPAKTVFYGGLNLNGAVTLQQSFLKKADMVVDIDVCKQYVTGGRTTYAGVYKFQQEQILKTNREVFKLPLLMEDGNTKNVGVFRGIYGIARSFDGGRLYIEKMPSKYKEGWEVKGTDAVSFAWLRPEGTIMKKALGLLTQKFLFTPSWGAWICEFTHDEVGVVVKEDFAFDCAEFTLHTVTNCFKEFVPDYEAEDYNPANYICESWADK